MDIKLICSDSMGVRSMAMYMETDQKISIDPSASLGPYRYGLRPTILEYRKLKEFKDIIHGYAESSNIIIITHYHYDHFDPSENFYSDKILLIKNGEMNINRSQKFRFEQFKPLINNFDFADGKEYNFGRTRIKFTQPFHHGNEKSALGYVIGVIIEESKKVMFTSDVEGPIVESVADQIISEKPDIVIIDGPATYFLGYRFSENDLERSINNLKRIAKEIDNVIIDHHLLRDLKYRERLEKIYSNGNVITYAEFNHQEINMLEAHRKDLYKNGEQEFTGANFEE